MVAAWRVIPVCLAALAAAAPAQAFDTGPHADVTRDALTAEGFNGASADIAAVENWFVDLYSQASKIPHSGHGGAFNRLVSLTVFPESWSQAWLDAAEVMHFDSTKTLRPDAQPKGLANTPGVEREWLRLMRNTALLTSDAKQRQDPLELLATIGMSLHTVQDFYAHSNWVEPAGAPGYRGPGWTARGYGDFPTWFDLPKGERDGSVIEMAGAAGSPRGHGGWKSDGNRDLTSAHGKDWPGRPLWQEAYITSYFASRQWVRAIRTWLGDDALWRRAQRMARTSRLAHDVAGAKEISLYAGRWQGSGGPCVPTNEGGGAFSCGPLVGAAGSLLNLRQAVNGYFDRGPSAYRRMFERIVTTFGLDLVEGQPLPDLPAVSSSAEIQAQTQFVKLQATRIEGLDLGDPGPDDADLYVEARIAGQPFDSTVIHAHDRFGFPRPYHPFTWLRGVPVGGRYPKPVTHATLRVRTGDVRFAGTDDDVSVRLGTGLRLGLDKRLYDDFERGDDDTYSLPLDRATRDGLSLRDITRLRIEKARDGPAGGWRLGGVRLVVDGRTLFADDRVNRWLEDDRRTWTAPRLTRDNRTTPALPVWLSLREDDLVYGGDDLGDVNPFDRRTSEAVAYTPGTTVRRTVAGGFRLGGRLGLANGDRARLSYVLTTVRGTPPPPLPVPTGPAPPPVADPSPGTGGGGSPPPTGTGGGGSTPVPPKPSDLVLTALGVNTFTVRNQGAGDAGPFTVTVTGFPPVRIAEGLAAGAETTRSYSSGCFPGDHTGRADSLEEIAESDETNNSRTLAGVIC